LYDSEESSGRAGFVAGAGAGFQWMSLKQRRLSETEESLKGIMEEVDDHCLRRAPTRLPSASSLAQRLLPLPAKRFLDALVMEEESLDWQRLEGKRFGERLGAPTVLFMEMEKRSWAWIVVHIARNLEGGKASLTYRCWVIWNSS
jgi:hypothetical protein